MANTRATENPVNQRIIQLKRQLTSTRYGSHHVWVATNSCQEVFDAIHRQHFPPLNHGHPLSKPKETCNQLSFFLFFWGSEWTCWKHWLPFSWKHQFWISVFHPQNSQSLIFFLYGHHNKHLIPLLEHRILFREFILEYHRANTNWTIPKKSSVQRLNEVTNLTSMWQGGEKNDEVSCAPRVQCNYGFSVSKPSKHRLHLSHQNPRLPRKKKTNNFCQKRRQALFHNVAMIFQMNLKII